MDNGILTDLLNTFTGVFKLGFDNLLPDAQHLLSLLATLEVLFAAMWWAFDDGQRVEVELLKKVILIGFFIWIVGNYKWLVEMIVQGFIYVGGKAVGRKSLLLTNPSLIIDYGFRATDPIFRHIQNYSKIAIWKIPDVILTGLTGLLLLLAYFAIAIVVFITYLEFYLIAVLGLILVPFGVFKHTAFLSEKIFGAVIAYGIRLMVLAFILAVIDPVIAKVTLPEDPGLPQVCTVLLTALTIAGLSWHAPGIASGLMAGAPSLGPGAVLGTGFAAAAGIVGAGAAMGLGSVAHGITSGAAKLAGVGVEKTRAAVGAALHGGGGGGGGGTGISGGGYGVPTSTTASSLTTPISKKPASGRVTSSASARNSGDVPAWAQNILIAQRAIPQDSHPGAGISVPLGRG